MNLQRIKQIGIFVYLILFSIFSYGQNDSSKKNIHIDSAGVVNIYGKGNVFIGKAIINETLKTKLFLLSITHVSIPKSKTV